MQIPDKGKEYSKQTASNLPGKNAFLFAHEIVFSDLSGPVGSNLCLGSVFGCVFDRDAHPSSPTICFVGLQSLFRFDETASDQIR